LSQLLSFMGVQSVLWAGCLLVWNDIFRPVPWARNWGFLHPQVFPSHYFCAAVLLVAVGVTRWQKRWNTASTVITVLLAWVWISAIWAESWEVAQAKAIESTKYLIPVLIMSIALTTRRWQQIFIYMLAFSVGIWMAWHGYLTLVLRGATPETTMSIPHGQMTDRNDFLVAGTGCLPLLLYVAWRYEGIFQRWVRVGTKILCAFACVVFFTSLSRGAMLGLAMLLMFYAIGTGRFGRRVIIVAVLLCGVLPMIPDFVWGRMGTIEWSQEQTEGSAANRMALMIAGWEMTLDHPIVGVGPDNYFVAVPRYTDRGQEPHSIWLKCSSEFGMTMLIFFVATMSYFVLALRKVTISARRRGDKATELMGLSLCCAIVGFLATGSWTSQFLSEYLWSIVAVSGAFLALERTRKRQEEEPNGEGSPSGRLALAGA
jgi:hypothetical protein